MEGNSLHLKLFCRIYLSDGALDHSGRVGGVGRLTGVGAHIDVGLGRSCDALSGNVNV